MAQAWRTVMNRLTLLLVLILAAAAVSPAAPAASPIRIGASLSFEGAYCETSRMMHSAYRLWAEQVNARGGLLGRPVELIVLDDRSSPEAVRANYERLIQEERVDLVLSPYGTPLTLRASEVTEEQGLVLLASAASGKAIWERGFRHVFGMYALADRYFIGFLDLLARNGFREVGILHEDNPFNRDAAAGAERWAGKLGLRVAARRAWSPEDRGFATFVQEFLQGEPEAVILCAYPPLCHRFLSLLEGRAVRPRALAQTIAPVHPRFPDRAGPMAEGVFAPSQWEPDERIPFPGTEAFIAAFERFAGIAPSYHAGAAFAACQVLAKAVTETESLDHDRLRRYILSLDTVTVIGRFKVDAAGQQIGHNPITIQWQDERKEIVYPPTMQTAEPRFRTGKPGRP